MLDAVRNRPLPRLTRPRARFSLSRCLSPREGSMNPNRLAIVSTALLLSFATAGAHAQGREANCSALPTAEQLKQFLAAAPSHGGEAGGVVYGARMWAAGGDRHRGPCAFATSSAEPTH